MSTASAPKPNNEFEKFQVHRLRLCTDIPLRANNIPNFRGAVVEMIGRDHELFHNHNNSQAASARFKYAYPLIQYRIEDGKASIYFFQEATKQVQLLMPHIGKEIKINGKKYAFNVSDLSGRTTELYRTEEMQAYELQNWLALNQKNHAEFVKLTRLTNRIQFLEGRIASHVIGMAKKLNWQIQGRFDIHINDWIMPEKRFYKSMPMQLFNLRFSTNLNLGSELAIGKGVSRGYGQIKCL